MALSTTANYSLRKHDAGDLNWDVDVNWNMTEIDKKLKLLFANFLTCSTAIGTAAKTAAFSNFVLETGCLIAVKFTNGNSASGATLDVNSTGAKAIQVNGAAVAVGAIIPNGIYLLVYDGTNWDILNPITLSDSITDGETGLAPTQNAVFDALALKADASDVADALALKADADDVINALESAVDENIPIFDGVTGDKLKDSGVKLSDKADVTAVADALALKADVTAVTAALLLKADITSLEIEKKLLMDEIDSLKKSAIENSNAPYLTASDYGAVALAKNSVGVGTMGVDGVTVENLITNGDFSNGTTGWFSNKATVSIINNLLKIQYTALYGEFRQGKLFSDIGHKYYAKTVIITDAPVNEIKLVVGNVNNQPYVYLDSSVAQTGLQVVSGVFTVTAQNNAFIALKNYSTTTEYTTYIDADYGVLLYDLTANGLETMSVEQLDKLAPEYFSGKKTFGGIGCLISKDADSNEVGRQYFSTTPMYSNATAKDTLTYSGGKYYHTHNVDSDGNAIAEPYDTEVETNGQFLALSEGTVTYEPWYPDIAVYTDKFTLTKAITAVKELYKHGSETPITDAVIAEDGLSFTSASLTAGDLAYGVFEFSEPLRPLMTIKSRNDDATVVDTANGKVYTFRPVVTNGAIASWELTEV